MSDAGVAVRIWVWNRTNLSKIPGGDGGVGGAEVLTDSLRVRDPQSQKIRILTSILGNSGVTRKLAVEQGRLRVYHCVQFTSGKTITSD